MSRIAAEFEKLKREGRKGFIPFVTAGDPELDLSYEIVLKLAETGATVIELGVPFSDPMADGPTIQMSSQRSLQKGTNLSRIFDLVERLREKTEVPIVLFSYLNPLLQFGLHKLSEKAANAGIDGILVTDVIDEEAKKFSDILRVNDLDLISLVAPTSTDERIEKITSVSSGFIYAVSRAGVTGAQKDVSSTAENLVGRVRKFTDLPVAVGFGISTRQQVEKVWGFADAAVVGSAIVADIERSRDSGNVIANLESFVATLLP
ncbi:MAG: tryptophan synthase subunit alpha [Pyrinomonadaceae bacterium]